MKWKTFGNRSSAKQENNMIEQWLATIDLNSFAFGAMGGLVIALLLYFLGLRKGSSSEREKLTPEIGRLEHEPETTNLEFADTTKELAVFQTRLEEQEKHFEKEKAGLEKAEKRLTESFERLAGKVFDDRSKQFTDLSEKQLEGLLKPLTKDLETFRETADKTHKEDIRQHAQLQERLNQLEGLNQQLNEEAKNLTKALTSDVKAQGNWGEQQLERLMELAGLKKGEHYYAQYSAKNKEGKTLQPDFVLMLPEGRSIILDSKVSLTDWTRYQAATDETSREASLNNHVQSIKNQIDNLSGKNYPAVEELNALDFVLMFVPIESALIAALQKDSSLPEYALKRNVALLSPANFLATVRTVASVWQIHKQNTNAQLIAERAGYLYDKFKGFIDNLVDVKSRMEQARTAMNKAISQLSEGPGNLVGQAQKLSDLGARHAKQLEAGLVSKATEDEDPDDPHLKLVKPEDE
jgi:DNA recombination protein RmuC